MDREALIAALRARVQRRFLKHRIARGEAYLSALMNVPPSTNWFRSPPFQGENTGSNPVGGTTYTPPRYDAPVVDLLNTIAEHD